MKAGQTLNQKESRSIQPSLRELQKSGLGAADNSSAEILPECRNNNNSDFSKTFYCEECYFKDHEGHSDNGSIKSMLTKEYQAWKALSDRPDQLKALWEKNYSSYGHLVK